MHFICKTNQSVVLKYNFFFFFQLEFFTFFVYFGFDYFYHLEVKTSYFYSLETLVEKKTTPAPLKQCRLYLENCMSQGQKILDFS